MEINERASVKRQYAQHPAIKVNEKAFVRNNTIDFVGNKTVKEEEFNQLFLQLSEQKGKAVNGKTRLKENSKYFNIKYTAEGKEYSLNKIGQRVLEIIRKTNAQPVNEGLVNILSLDYFLELSEAEEIELNEAKKKRDPQIVNKEKEISIKANIDKYKTALQNKNLNKNLVQEYKLRLQYNQMSLQRLQLKIKIDAL